MATAGSVHIECSCWQCILGGTGIFKSLNACNQVLGWNDEAGSVGPGDWVSVGQHRRKPWLALFHVRIEQASKVRGLYEGERRNQIRARSIREPELCPEYWLAAMLALPLRLAHGP